MEMELHCKVQTHSQYRKKKKETRFLQTGQISFHEKVKKKDVSCSRESQAKYMSTRHSPIMSCQSQSKRCGTAVKLQTSTRENMFSKYQQALVHCISGRILCTVPCLLVLLIDVQGNYRLTGGDAQWSWESRKLERKRLTAWLKLGQCLTPECIRTQHWRVLLFQRALSLPAEVLHYWPPSYFACFKCCSLFLVSARGSGTKY